MSQLIENSELLELPIIPLRGLVVFPDMILHFDVGRKKSVLALKNAMDADQSVFLVSQRDAALDDPSIDDMFEVGVICNVKQMIKIPGSENLRVVVEGAQRAKITAMTQVKPFLAGSIEKIDEENDRETETQLAYARAVKKEFEEYVKLVPKISNDVITKVISLQDSSALADFICSNTFLDYYDKQSVLETKRAKDRLKLLLVLLKTENNTLELENEIHDKVQNEIDKNQREYYLREEMRVIAESLGEGESPIEEADLYRKKIYELKCDEEVTQKLLKETDKLVKMPPGSHEATVLRNYIDKCLEIPFGKMTKDSVRIDRARSVLDKDHYGMDKVKDRIVESLAVYKRNPDFSGQILCLAGPPGVGKTSVVRSLAKSMNRKYVRVALGGIHDEAEIRGHRKTYIGAMPGRIIDAVIRSGVMNPIILLDEIDKIGADFKGDPSSALLEALDPEQNSTFTDHYIEMPVDLSKVLFVTTANDTGAISAPLYDRMEIIELNSYTGEEKYHIAKEHLIKKEMKKHSLNGREFKISDDAINDMIVYYTREAGVRKLEKTIATLCRKAVVQLEGKPKSVKITSDNLDEFLGVKKFSKDTVPPHNLVGTVNGLAWTSVGGTLLPIEISVFDGTGKIEITGNLGKVMTESAKTAVGYIRSKVSDFGIDTEFYKNKDIHIHAPEGAIPKDGPSAGLAITTALVSELCNIPIISSVAMTGEISLKGKAMAIGGLKEKSMAAYKSGCKTVIIPKENEKDLADISKEVKNAVDFVAVSSFEDVMPIALEYLPIKNVGKKKKDTPIISQKKRDTSVITQ